MFYSQTLLIFNYSVYYDFYEVDVLKEKKKRKEINEREFDKCSKNILQSFSFS